MAGAAQNDPKGGNGAQLAKSVALHLMQLLGAATVYLGRTALDLIDVIKRALLLRNRRKFPERAAKIDSTVSILRDREAQRWSSWATVAVGRRMEVRAAALTIVIATVFVTYAWLNLGTLEHAQAIAAHESPRTTKLYDRTTDEIRSMKSSGSELSFMAAQRFNSAGW